MRRAFVVMVANALLCVGCALVLLDLAIKPHASGSDAVGAALGVALFAACGCTFKRRRAQWKRCSALAAREAPGKL